MIGSGSRGALGLLDLPSAALERIASLMPGGARRELRAACRELRDAANGGTTRMTITPAELYRHVARALPARASRPRFSDQAVCKATVATAIPALLQSQSTTASACCSLLACLRTAALMLS